MREAMATNIRATRRGSSELAGTIQPAKEAARRLGKLVGRFEIYDFLGAVYRVYARWKDRRVAKRSARILARELNIVRREGMSPIRVLIEATLPNADFKQKSRWVRALEYVSSENVPPKHFRTFVRLRGGLAGCARLAVRVARRRRRPGGDWEH
jgi:sulfite reductase beta subunit-like hemoprotein